MDIRLEIAVTACLDANGLARVQISRPCLPSLDITDWLYQHEFEDAERQSTAPAPLHAVSVDAL